MSGANRKAGTRSDLAQSEGVKQTVAREDGGAAAENLLARLQAGAGNQAVRSLFGDGRPLPDAVRGEMQQRFGADLGAVRVHDHSEAHAAAATLRAKAFTHGQDIVFGKGRYAPATMEGRKLLAHELAHVIQQSRGAGYPGGGRDLAEAEAAGAAAALSNDGSISITGTAAIGVARAPENEAEPAMPSPLAEGGFIEADGERSRRSEERRLTLERKAARSRAGKDPQDIVRGANEAELRMLEEMAWSPEAKSWSLENKDRLFNRYEELLAEVRPEYPGMTRNDRSSLIKAENQRRSAFHEQLYTPRETATPPQTNWVGGHPETPHQDIRLGIDAHARPDYSVYRRNSDGVLERVHVNLKAHKLHERTPAEARSIARSEIAPQAVRNAAHLPTGEPIIISFVRTPSEEVRAAMLEELFFEGSPITEVRFGGAAYKRDEYGGRRAPAAVKSVATKRPPARSLREKAPTSRAAAERLIDEYRNMSLERLAALAGVDGKTWEDVPRANVDVTARQVWDQYVSMTRSELRDRAARGDKLATKFHAFHEALLSKAPRAQRLAGPKSAIPGPPIEPGAASSSEPVSLRAEVKPQDVRSDPISLRPPSRSVVPGQRMIIPKSAGDATTWGKAPPRPPVTRRVAGALGEAGWAAMGEMLGNALENINEMGIRSRTEDEIAKLVPQIRAYQQAHPQDGVLIVVQIETWDPVWRPSDARPTRSFVSVVPQYGGMDRHEAIERWASAPKLLQGPSPGSTMGSEFVWISPGQYVPLSKSRFINGRYVSSTDSSRLLNFQFGDDGSFHCDAVHPLTRRPYKVEVIKPWTASLDEPAIRLVARFTDPVTQISLESEFSVLNTEWIQESWKATTGQAGDNFWHKTDQ